MTKQKYIFKTTFDVYENDYHEGEGQHVNFFSQQDIIESDDLESAIKELFKKKLYYKYHRLDMYVEDNGTLHYSLLVDNDNIEVNPEDSIFEKWKNGEVVLYSCGISIRIFKLQLVDEELKQIYNQPII